MTGCVRNDKDQRRPEQQHSEQTDQIRSRM